jgi:hypothetical protein
MGSVCITVTVQTIIPQGEWHTPDAVTATEEALAISTGFSIGDIHVNYADRLCQAPIILSPSQRPGRKTLTTESIPSPSIFTLQQNSTPASVYDSKMSLVHIAADKSTSQQVQFSVDIRVSG